jgi:poly-gamma-glutamate synthesis protein (capsule biosynthesis protein)
MELFVLLTALVFLAHPLGSEPGAGSPSADRAATAGRPEFGDGDTTVVLFLAGDVMTGRGIDQILAHPGDPTLCERYMQSAQGYVGLAERASGRLPRGVGDHYIWGDSLAELTKQGPDARIINLETAVTTSGFCRPGKAVHYRMNPANLSCLTAADIDVCALANNHVLDWGVEGLGETLATLERGGIEVTGAGRDQESAGAPAVVPLPGGGRLLVFAFGSATSGVPADWAAGTRRMGVNFLQDLSPAAAAAVAELVNLYRNPGDLVVISIHWGSNWGYEVPRSFEAFAHRLIESGMVDLIHGHSSHHIRPMEVYRGKLILYGCGDLLNDYEGIPGRREFRPDLSLMYFPRLERNSGRLASLVMTPMRIHRFRLERAGNADAQWLAETLNREGRRYGVTVRVGGDGTLELSWDRAGRR